MSAVLGTMEGLVVGGRGQAGMGGWRASDPVYLKMLSSNTHRRGQHQAKGISQKYFFSSFFCMIKAKTIPPINMVRSHQLIGPLGTTLSYSPDDSSKLFSMPLIALAVHKKHTLKNGKTMRFITTPLAVIRLA